MNEICVSKKIPQQGMYCKCKKLTYMGNDCFVEDYDAGWLTHVEKMEENLLYKVRTVNGVEIFMFVFS